MWNKSSSYLSLWTFYMRWTVGSWKMFIISSSIVSWKVRLLIYCVIHWKCCSKSESLNTTPQRSDDHTWNGQETEERIRVSNVPFVRPIYSWWIRYCMIVSFTKIVMFLSFCVQWKDDETDYWTLFMSKIAEGKTNHSLISHVSIWIFFRKLS